MQIEAYAGGLKPEEFWRLTPHEVYQVLRGRGRALEAGYEIAAWHMAALIRVVTGESVRPGQLLGTEKTIDLLQIDPSQLEDVLEVSGGI